MVLSDNKGEQRCYFTATISPSFISQNSWNGQGKVQAQANFQKENIAQIDELLERES